MKVLILNEWYNPVSQNLIYYFACLLGPNNLNWTGKRYYNKFFLPLNEIEEASHVDIPLALTRLQSGYYDFAIFSDQTSFLFLSSHLPRIGVKRIMIDATDSIVIPRWYLENSEIYFKCQMHKKEVIVSNKSDSKPRPTTQEENEKIFKFCLTPVFKISTSNTVDKRVSAKNFDVFFNGSAWPKKRVELVSKIKSCPEINFFGGLYNRSDLIFNNVVPDSIRFKSLNYEEYMMAISSSKICLNIEGNGKNCFRQYEVLHSGGFLLTQEHNNYFGPIEPINKKHCVFFKEDGSDLIDLIHYYINNEKEREEIANNGKIFFEENYHPSSLVKYMLNIMEKNGYKNE